METLSEYVGVISPFDLLSTTLKREALYFDSIAIPNIEGECSFKGFLERNPDLSINYLIQKGVVFDPVQRYVGNDTYWKKIGRDVYDERLDRIEHLDARLASELKRRPKLPPFPSGQSLGEIFSYPWSNAIARFFLGFERYIGVPLSKVGFILWLFGSQWDYDRRRLAADLRIEHSVNAFPLYSSNMVLIDDFIEGKNEVIRAAIRSIPEPDLDSVPWEEILNFRNHEENKQLLCFFRHWASEVAQKQLTAQQLHEEIEYYCAKYKEYIAKKKMKVRYSTLETLLMVPARVVEGLLGLKPTQAVEALFTFRKQHVELREAELKAPGRDLAYLLKVREEFPSKTKGVVKKASA